MRPDERIQAALMIIVLAYGYVKLNQQSQGQNIKVAAVQGNIPQRMKWDLENQNYILEQFLLLLTKQRRLYAVHLKRIHNLCQMRMWVS